MPSKKPHQIRKHNSSRKKPRFLLSGIKFPIFLLATISLLTYLSLRESLNTALSGDDWLMVYTIWMDSVVRKAVSYWNIKTYLSTYGPPYGFMSIIIHYFGYIPYYYYLVSLITRILASFSIFYLVKRYSKSFQVAFLASIFFAVSYIGIQSTDWVFNFNHYIGIIFGSIFLITYYKVRKKPSIPGVMFTGALFALCLLLSPNRMHGMLPLVLIMEFAWFLIEGKKFNFKNFAIRFITLLASYKIVFSGAGYGSTEYNLSLVQKGVDIGLDLLSKKQIWFLLNPISSLGNYIVPDLFYQDLPFNTVATFLNRPGSFFIHFLTILGSIGIVGAILLTLLKTKFSILMIFSGSLLSWAFVMRYIKRLNPIEYSGAYADYAAIGGGIIIFTFFLFFQLKRTKPQLAHLLLGSLGWMVAFTLFPWLLAPYSVLETTIRYSIQQAIGAAIWFSIIFYLLFNGLSKRNNFKIFLIPASIALFLFLKMNIDFSNIYFDKLNLHRGSQLDKKLWSEITTKVTDIPDDRSSIFYLIYDDYLTAEIGLRSGFSARAAMHYNIRDQNNNPYMIFNYEDIISIVTTGEAWANQGEPAEVTPLDYVFAFKLENNNITDTTEKFRATLAKDIEKHNESSKK